MHAQPAPAGTATAGWGPPRPACSWSPASSVTRWALPGPSETTLGPHRGWPKPWEKPKAGGLSLKDPHHMPWALSSARTTAQKTPSRVPLSTFLPGTCILPPLPVWSERPVESERALPPHPPITAQLAPPGLLHSSSPGRARGPCDVGDAVQEAQLLQARQLPIQGSHGPGPTTSGRNSYHWDLEERTARLGEALGKGKAKPQVEEVASQVPTQLTHS